ncbi:hypothetical protein GCM10010168_47640 [Actinoplanes ianthinogenes]|uniref:Uncharacterized protein n=1 Tax=Actinoplanes ianthinogenes TaxID=122358 RepID=A0ABM7LNU8_9ACTN|nr:hypothetical protein Aiant_15930 [Actinoplanes ianthinogenes]GGR24098.1 hypothetical protein GCM10010168_47640 [Actinoplanes ianthinogenes]
MAFALRQLNVLPALRGPLNVVINSEPDGPKRAGRRIEQGRGETIMRWPIASESQRQMLRGESAMARSGRPQAALIKDLPVPGESQRDPERWRG